MQRTVNSTYFIVKALLIVGLLGGFFVTGAPVHAQDDITFSASLDRETLSSDQMLNLELTLAGTFTNADRPDLTALTDFVVVGSSQSSQFSMVNSKTSSQIVFSYRLQPAAIGVLTIPPISIQVAGQTYQTQALNVEVTQGSAPVSQTPGQGAPPEAVEPASLVGQDLFVEAGVDNPTPFVGQQLVYTFRFYQAVNVSGRPSLDWPEFTGFLGYDLTPNNQYYQTVGGREYLVTEVRRALFPTAPGQVTLGPAALVVPGDFFNNGFQMETDSLVVDVQALPQGAPESFSGAVGQFAIESWVEPVQTRANEPLALFVRVSGAGNLDVLADPTAALLADLPGWRVYDPQVSTDLRQDGDFMQGEKVFERLLVPKTEGSLTIPAFELSYFDPQSLSYQQVQTAPLDVAVALGEEEAPSAVIIGNDKQEVVLLGNDIRHIKPAPPALMPLRTSLVQRPAYWLGWCMGGLAVLGAWFWERRQHTLLHNVAYARLLRARKMARRRLSDARKLIATDEDAAYSAVAQALHHYLGDKFNLPAAGLTRDVMRETLYAQSVDGALLERLLAGLDWADSGRFAPVAAGRGAEALVQEAEAIVTALEGVLL